MALCDQFAGSDGDIVCHAFKAYGIGPLIGKRTWGGVIGIDVNEVPVDGTIVTQPEFASYFQGLGWGLENYGVDPDIEVENDPRAVIAGRDPQLERGIEEVMKAIKADPRKLPSRPADPVKTR